MKKIILVILAFTLLGLSACGGNSLETQPSTPTPIPVSISEENDPAPQPEPVEEEWVSARLGGRFTLAVGETAVIEKGLAWVTFHEVLEDSRCPRDVVCVWAGRVVVSISLHHNDGLLLPLELSEWDDNEYSHQAEIEGLLLQVQRVEPYPVSGTTISPQDYQVTLVVNSAP